MRAEVTFANNMGPLTDQIRSQLVQGMNLAAERLLALSAEEVPHDLGTLSGSGAVQPARTVDEAAEVSYNTPYATGLHEHPEYNFQKGRKGKYLEDPALENKDELGAIIAKQAQGG